MFVFRKGFLFLKTKTRLMTKFNCKVAKAGKITKNFCYLHKVNVEKFFDKKKIEELPTQDIKIEPKKEDLIIEFTSEIDWENTVIKSELPVVVDCYADWCGPCKKLLPVIKKKLEEQKNFKLVKINIDKNQELADKMGIESIPAVFLVYKGQVIDNFTGFPPEKRLNEFFQSINLLRGVSTDDNIIRSLLKGADQFLEKKQWDQAENMFNEAFSHEKWRKKYGYIIKLGLAYCSYHKNEYDKSEKIVKEITEKNAEEIKNDEDLRMRIANLEIKIMTRKNPFLLHQKLETLESDLTKNPKDIEIRYHLAIQYFEHSEFEKAVNVLLEIIHADKNWNNKSAHQLLIRIFNFLGDHNKVTVEGRKKLAKILF